MGDTHGYLYVSYSSAQAWLGGGNSGKLVWQKKIPFIDSEVNPTTMTHYYVPIFADNNTGSIRYNNGLRYYLVTGTTSVLGDAYLTIGNDIAKGKANNERGALRLYSDQGGYIDLRYQDGKTSNITSSFSDIAGTISVSSGGSARNIEAMASATYESNKNSFPNGSIVAVW